MKKRDDDDDLLTYANEEGLYVAAACWLLLLSLTGWKANGKGRENIHNIIVLCHRRFLLFYAFHSPPNDFPFSSKTKKALPFGLPEMSLNII